MIHFGNRGERLRGYRDDALSSAVAALVADESFAGVVERAGGPEVCAVFDVHASTVM